MKRQRGFALLAMVAGLLITATVVFSITLLNAATSKSGQSAELNKNMAAIRQALIQFATIHHRLPCPADGAALNPANDQGTASPATATNACTSNQAAGVVPWATLGLPREVSVDPWGRKISYRVFQGASGLTRTNGLRCDTALPNASTLPDCALLPAALTLVTAIAPNNPDIAFVLVSHGATGSGARLPQGGQLLPLPSAANVAERGNYSSAGPYYDVQQSGVGTDAGAANHFDDVVVYMTRDSLAQSTGAKRNWP